jgi:hypothetical protein
MGILSCFCCPATPPEFGNAASYLTAQCDDLLSDTLVPALAAATPATLVYGTKMFANGTLHGFSPAAECTLTTLEGKQLTVRLDSGGLHLVSANDCFCEVSDLLASHSPGYVAAFTQLNGVPPTVQRRKATRSTPRRRKMHLDHLISRTRMPTAAVRLHDMSEMSRSEGLPRISEDGVAIAPTSYASNYGSSAGAEPSLSTVDEPTLAPVLIERMPSGGSDASEKRGAPRGTTRLVLNATGRAASSAANAACTNALHVTRNVQAAARAKDPSQRSLLAVEVESQSCLPSDAHASAHASGVAASVVATPSSRRWQRLTKEEEESAETPPSSARPSGTEPTDHFESVEVDLSAPSAAFDERADEGAHALPAAAHALVGQWRHLHSDGYAEFLADVVGLPKLVRMIAERIHPTPNFTVHDGQLHCETVCLGGKPVVEELVVGSTTFLEPNQGVTFDVDGWWEGDAHVASRRHPTVNGGLPTVQRRAIDAATGELVVTQDWGGMKRFVAHYARK